MRSLVVLLAALALAACGEPAPGDAGAMSADAGPRSDAAAGDGGATDGGATDGGATGDAGDCTAGGTRVLVDLGHCFEARTCCVDADCGGERAWVCNEDGLCEDSGRACGCVDDLDCPGGAFCFTNAVVCGICAPTRPPCVTDASCEMGARCVDGYCVDDTACMGYPPS